MVKVLEVVDEELEYMGNYFVENNINEKEGITFLVFVNQVKNGRQLDKGKGDN